ncbi:MAG TPA: hypothetical protein EYP04_06770 [Anaerolineae bacterium]|nr:hypothetical protein [Anaerolineae bacterium]HIQ05484.1 hypothetical protein [Anaerolineae bacterium]
MRRLRERWLGCAGWAVVLAGLGLLVTGVVLRWVQRVDRYVYTDPEAIPPERVAIVFGAGVLPGGRLTPMLADRVETAAALYQQGRVRKLLMSGDNRFVDYNEPGTMAAYARALGVPAEDIVLDYAGRRTYDTCYRAKAIFGLREAVLVTQRFHLRRALLTCRGLGLDAVGVIADRQPYFGVWWNEWRELPATALALWQVYVTKPLPVLGEPLPIDG